MEHLSQSLALIPSMVELFQQAPVRRPFLGLNRATATPRMRKTWPYPESLEDFEPLPTTSTSTWSAKRDRCVAAMNNDEEDGPTLVPLHAVHREGISKHLSVMAPHAQRASSSPRAETAAPWSTSTSSDDQACTTGSEYEVGQILGWW